MAETPEFQQWAKVDREPVVEQSTERIRTYNLIDQRVTDHRTGHKSSAVQAILDGDIDKLYDV
jgi:protein subunit release factor A